MKHGVYALSYTPYMAWSRAFWDKSWPWKTRQNDRQSVIISHLRHGKCKSTKDFVTIHYNDRHYVCDTADLRPQLIPTPPARGLAPVRGLLGQGLALPKKTILPRSHHYALFSFHIYIDNERPKLPPW